MMEEMKISSYLDLFLIRFFETLMVPRCEKKVVQRGLGVSHSRLECLRILGLTIRVVFCLYLSNSVFSSTMAV